MQAPLLCIAGLLCVAPNAAAQSVKIDFGTSFGTPSASHVAAGQAGIWNALDLPVNTALDDVHGCATGASVTTLIPETEFSSDNPDTSGEVEALLDDGIDAGFGNTVLFTGLQDGHYRVLTYAWAPDFTLYITIVNVVGSPDPPQEVGAPWSGSYVARRTVRRAFARGRRRDDRDRAHDGPTSPQPATGSS